MGYRRFLPHPALRPFVESFWLQEASTPNATAPPTRVVPTCGVELIVCFGAPFEQLIRHEKASRMPMALVAGQRSRSIVVRATGRTGLVIARCHPWTAGGWLGDGSKDLTGRHIALNEVTGASDATVLAEQVAEAPSGEARVRLVERFLFEWLDGRKADPLVVAAVQRIAHPSGKVAVSALAEHCELSPRQLHRRFVASTGVGPKQLARLARLQRAVGALREGRSWVDITWSCGYVDQAHLIHEIQEFLDRSPREVVRRPMTPLMRFFNRSRSGALNTTSYI